MARDTQEQRNKDLCGTSDHHKLQIKKYGTWHDDISWLYLTLATYKKVPVLYVASVYCMSLFQKSLGPYIIIYFSHSKRVVPPSLTSKLPCWECSISGFLPPSQPSPFFLISGLRSYNLSLTESVTTHELINWMNLDDVYGTLLIQIYKWLPTQCKSLENNHLTLIIDNLVLSFIASFNLQEANHVFSHLALNNKSVVKQIRALTLSYCQLILGNNTQKY